MVRSTETGVICQPMKQFCEVALKVADRQFHVDIDALAP